MSTIIYPSPISDLYTAVVLECHWELIFCLQTVSSVLSTVFIASVVIIKTIVRKRNFQHVKK